MKKHKSKSTEPVALDSQVDRFDLEQQIMQCWSMVDDVKLFAEQGAPSCKITASIVYNLLAART